MSFIFFFSLFISCNLLLLPFIFSSLEIFFILFVFNFSINFVGCFGFFIVFSQLFNLNFSMLVSSFKINGFLSSSFSSFVFGSKHSFSNNFIDSLLAFCVSLCILRLHFLNLWLLNLSLSQNTNRLRTLINIMYVLIEFSLKVIQRAIYSLLLLHLHIYFLLSVFFFLLFLLFKLFVLFLKISL